MALTYWQLIDKDSRWCAEQYVRQCAYCSLYFCVADVTERKRSLGNALIDVRLTEADKKQFTFIARARRELKYLTKNFCIKCANKVACTPYIRHPSNMFAQSSPLMSSSSVVPLCQVPLCPACGVQCKTGVSGKPGANFGREFWSCPNSKDGERTNAQGVRHHFAWKSPAASAITAPSPVVQATHDSTLNEITSAIKQMAQRVSNLEMLVNNLQVQLAATQTPALSQHDISSLING